MFEIEKLKIIGIHFLTDKDPTTITNPLNPDTDGDGLYDGWKDDGDGNPENGEYGEDKNANGKVDIASWNLGNGPGETSPLTIDTDDDGMPDNWEWNYENIWFKTNGNIILNPLDSSDADEDYDEDTLTNLEEFQYGFTLSGKTLNPRDADPDDDKMNDSYEINYGLDPFVDDGDEDPDNDGLINEYEYCLNTNGVAESSSIRLDPMNSDTDGDGVKDGDETYLLANYAGHVFNTETDVNWYDDFDGDGLINAMDSDSDDDGLEDGLEISSCEVQIFITASEGKNPDTKVNVAYRNSDTVGSCGLDPVDSNNIKLDTDGDNLEDYKENNPATYFPDYTEDMTDDEINAQFNPFVREIMPPRIYNIDINEAIETGIIYKTVDGGPLGSYEVPSGYFIKHVWLSVEGDVFDISGVDSVKVVIDDDVSEIIIGDGSTDFHFQTTEDSLDVLDAVSLDTYLIGSYDINIIAMDGAGNIADLELEQKSIVATLTDAFLNLMGEIWDTAVDTALALGEMLYDWIIQIILDKLFSIFDDISTLADDYLQNILNSFNNFVIELNQFDWDSSSTMPQHFDENREIEDVIIAEFGLLSSIFALNYFADSIMGVMNDLSSKITPYQKYFDFTEIIWNIFNVLNIDSSLIETATNIQDEAMESLVNPLIEFFFSKNDNSLLTILGINLDGELCRPSLSEKLPKWNALVNYMNLVLPDGSLLKSFILCWKGDGDPEPEEEDDVPPVTVVCMVTMLFIVIHCVIYHSGSTWSATIWFSMPEFIKNKISSDINKIGDMGFKHSRALLVLKYLSTAYTLVSMLFSNDIFEYSLILSIINQVVSIAASFIGFVTSAIALGISLKKHPNPGVKEHPKINLCLTIYHFFNIPNNIVGIADILYQDKPPMSLFHRIASIFGWELPSIPGVIS